MGEMVTFGISAQATDHCQTAVTARQHRFVVDEPPSLGGGDAGPNPVEYMLGAFAGCLNVVAHMIAGEMNINLRSLKLDLEGSLDPTVFLGKNPNGRPGFTEIRVKFHVDSDASAEQLEQWIAAVKSRCPVSDNIGNATPIVISL